MPVEHILRLIRIGFVERDDSAVEMLEGIPQRLHHLWLIGRESRNCLGVKARWRSGPERPGDTIVRADDVGKNLTHRANALGGTPGVLFSRHGLRQASISLLVVGDPFQELGAEPGTGCGGCHGGRFVVGASLSPAGRHNIRAGSCKYKEKKIFTTHECFLWMFSPEN